MKTSFHRLLIPLLALCVTAGCKKETPINPNDPGLQCHEGSDCRDGNLIGRSFRFNGECECEPVNFGQNVIVQDNVVIVTDEMNNYLSSITPEELTFSTGNPDLDGIVEGDIIVSGVHENAPKGYFRKITGISVVGDQRILSTTVASFTELFAQCDINFDYRAIPEDWTKSLGISINAPVAQGMDVEGSISFNPEFIWRMQVNSGVLSSTVDYFQLGFQTLSTSSLGVTLTPDEHQFFKGDYSLFEKDLLPLYFFVGPIPIVITPEVEVILEYQLNGPSMTFSYEADCSMSSIISYSGQDWSLNSSNSFSIPDASAGFSDVDAVGNLLAGEVALKLEIDFEFFDMEALEPEVFCKAIGRAVYGLGEDCGITPGVGVGTTLEVDFSYLIDFDQEFTTEIEYEFEPFPLPGCDDCPDAMPCDDNDPCTIDDTFNENCDCIGTFEDADGDGVCDSLDACPNFDDNLIGTPCDDNDPCTTNDIISEDCICIGTYEDGIPCDDNDPCTVDDTLNEDCECVGIYEDTDGDGICDSLDMCPNLIDALIGTPCDDGNPATINDVYLESCNCEGEPFGPGAGTFTDPRDGKTYNTIEIGNQTWFAENLNYDGATSWCYDDLAINCEEYGKLYLWSTAVNVCPSGWHLPSEAELIELVNFLGGQNQAGFKLREGGAEHWIETDPNIMYNESGFTGLPGGFGSVGNYLYQGTAGTFWSSTTYEIVPGNTSNANTLYIGHTGNNFMGRVLFSSKDVAASVRCIMD
ncbi:MAG: fibrobacter succinogenes major paralogous domain-containing protein [Bacteroidota bacterium]